MAKPQSTGVGTCSIPGCTRVVYGHGWCSRHYTRARRHGDPLWHPPEKTGGACAVAGCARVSSRRSDLGNLCRLHHRRWAATGDPNVTPSGRTVRTAYGSNICGECGQTRTLSGGHLRCLLCLAEAGRRRYVLGGDDARARSAVSAQRRRARERSAECAHGHGCVSESVLLAITNAKCVYCGSSAEHADHLMPLARGGLHCAENIVPACATCNRRKSDRDPFEWLVALEK